MKKKYICIQIESFFDKLKETIKEVMRKEDETKTKYDFFELQTDLFLLLMSIVFKNIIHHVVY